MTEKTSPLAEELVEIINAMPSAIHVVDRSLKIVFLNEALLKWLETDGLSKDILGKTPHEAFPFINRQILDEYDKVFESGLPLFTEETNQINDELQHVRIRKIPLFTDGQVTSVMTIVDKATKSTLTDADSTLFHQLCERAQHGIATAKLDGTLIYVNDAFASMHGYAREELIDKNLSIFHTEEQLVTVNTLNALLKERGWFTNEEVWHVKRDGKTFPTLMSASLLLDDKGRPTYMSATAIDISQWRKTERKLSVIEKSINRASPSIFWISAEGKFLFANETACKKLGYRQEELCQMYVHDIDPDHPKEVRKENWESYRTNKVRTFESYHRTKSGRVFPVEITSHHLNLDGQEMEFAFATDISTRRTALKALRESEERYRALFYASPNATLVVQDDKYVLANPASCKLFGYDSPEELEGQEILTTIAHHHRHMIKERVVNILAGDKNPPIELDIVRKDGTIITIDSVSVPITWQDKAAALVIAQDLTEQRKAAAALRSSEERYRSLEEQLRHAQKMEAIGTLAGGIAHDFNNILSAIFGFADIAAADAGDNQEVVDTLEDLVGAAQRAKELVKQILAFSRQNKVEMCPLRVQLIAAEAVKLLRSSISTTIEIKSDLSQKCGLVSADATQLHQVLINLGTNAYHAMEEQGGELTIKVRQVELSSVAAASLVNIHPGPYVEITVSDTGVGMSKEVQERMFDPYFTTKEKEKGTGLGMSTVHSIIADHQGAIQVFSQEGKGTTITILLPVCNKRFAKRLKKEDDGSLPFGSERILYVDDEAPILLIAKASLQRFGYQVHTENDPQLAFERFKEKPDAFDLIVTDQNMPHLTGLALSKKILDIRPDVPIILCTGFSKSINAETARAAGITEFAMKPIVGKQLAQIIRHVLDNKD